MYSKIPEIYCKSSIETHQIADRLSRDQNGIELQLFIKDSVEDLERLYFLHRGNIKSVHPPLDAEGEGLDAELSFDFPATHVYHRMYLDALNWIAEENEAPLRYVIHIEQSKKLLLLTGRYEWFIKTIRAFADAYENIMFCIENTSLTTRVTEPYMIADIVRDADRPNIKSCIDICHLQYCLHVDRFLKSGFERPGYLEEELSMEEMFRRNDGICGLIHLNQCGSSPYDSYGLGLNHGRGFFPEDPNDIRMLKDIWWLYVKYGYDCPITIEVKEQDYDHAVIYTESRKALQKAITGG